MPSTALDCLYSGGDTFNQHNRPFPEMQKPAYSMHRARGAHHQRHSPPTYQPLLRLWAVAIVVEIESKSFSV